MVAESNSNSLCDLQGLRGIEPGQEEQAPEEGVQKEGDATSIEKASTKSKPLRGFQELIKVTQAFLQVHKGFPASHWGPTHSSAEFDCKGMCA